MSDTELLVEALKQIDKTLGSIYFTLLGLAIIVTTYVVTRKQG